MDARNLDHNKIKELTEQWQKAQGESPERNRLLQASQPLKSQPKKLTAKSLPKEPARKAKSLPLKTAAAEVNTPDVILREARKITDSLLISFSGGKDSFVLLDLCSRYFDRLEGFFLYVVDDLRFIEDRIDYAQRRYNIKIRKYPHPLRFRYAQGGIYSLPSYDRAKIKWKDVEDVARHESGINWIASGWKKTDSLQRRGALSTFLYEGISEISQKIYPLSNFNDRMVVGYMRRNHIPKIKSPVKGQFEVELTYDKLKFIKDYYPNDYKKVIKEFPFAETMMKREELYNDAEQISEV